MGELFEEKKGLLQFLAVVIIAVWSVATIRYGFYVDENGLLSIYKGIYQGQHMFTDSWEALQTGGILAYPLLALYYQVLQPLFAELAINIGLVLYMRYCYLFIRFIVAIYLFCTLRSADFEDGAFSAAAFYFMFVVDWKNFSYKSYCDVAMVLILCFIIRFYNNRKPVYAVLSAVAVCISVLAYPTMIIMAVFLGVYWLVLAIQDEAPRSTVAGYVITCILIGAAVVIYLQFTTGWGNIIAQIPNLGDQDYDNPMYIRLGYMLATYVVFAGIAYFPIILIRIWDKLRGVAEETERVLLTLYFFLFMGGILVLRVDGISNSRFIYGCLIVFFWFPYFMRSKEDRTYTRIGLYRNTGLEQKKILWTVFIFSVVAQLIWSISTNQGIAVPGNMALYVVLAMILLFSKEEVDYRGMVALLMLLAMFFNGIWVADSNGGFTSVFEPMFYVERGELKGVALPKDEFNTNEAVMNLLEENVTADDKLLVAFGANCAGYLNSPAWQGTYSVYARTQLNTKIMDYYQLNPDNMADYMLLDKGHAKYESFCTNEAGQYLLNLYTNEIAKEGNIVLLAR
ncbi:hypothetical protein [Pseudobutyrivibrio xylanivorans]|uniref:Dolichyl-phosphate-mannose-protein mannosyltransferase n=1 Tax=Pseudobutyrivibrio xylanivorans TaxID=185007 RepID=A0A1G5RY40_PSEXY|nr:hypothetical protein [Pseudobutyrivibrio xylanivorans]SCZ78670.1 hypothetical protein SAMN02910350_01388 [Pseudobutyrivibrio xylanivorans]